MILRSLLVIGAGGLVLAGVLYVASTIDARAPQVLEVSLTQPVEGEPDVALITTSLEIVFSEPVEPDTASGALELDPEVEGAVSWSGSTMIFTPSEPLALDTAYRVELRSGVRDLSGNAMSDLPPPFEFRTAGRPVLVDASPADDATDVPVDQPLALTFSRLMDTSSVETALRLRPSFPHELRWSGALLEIVPTQPLRPGSEYEVSIQDDATDVAGVALGEPISVRFTTVAPGLVVETLVPADGIDGIAPTSPIAVVFDRPIDPGSVDDDTFTFMPEIAGTASVTTLPGEESTDEGSGRVLQFVPSGPMPANTTFEVTLSPGVTSTGGGGLGRAAAWSFTTGAPVAAISNQVTFVTDRAGVANVWAMNPDGTGKRQLSVELAPVLDYAIAPDGSSLVVSDGRRLVYQRADGSERRILTDAGSVEFDPSYAPDSQRIVFGRADLESGAGRGLWQWQVGGGEPTAVALPPSTAASPVPSASGAEASLLREPRYSPDGQALAFVDATGAVGILELGTERLTLVPFAAGGPPIWLPSSSAVLVTGHGADTTHEPELPIPVTPLMPDRADEVFRIARSGTAAVATSFGIGSRVVAVSQVGAVAYVDGLGALRVAERAGSPAGESVLENVTVADAAFAPGEPALVVALETGGAEGAIERIDIASGSRTELAPRGSLPRWVP
ncbi:MAG TPA: Ig-like domain-containing protein [Candidatus Limnocylindria bacterium]|nr:Ig-like domain-containing protein [Candidatus Limnocylindria bacterium]